MIYNDDELIDASSDVVSLGEKPPVLEVRKAVELTSDNKPDAPLEQTEVKVLVELMGSGNIEERYPVDLVVVLDVSGSMNKEDKIEELKIAMQCLVNKLSSIDRLSVVTFSRESTRLFPLRWITDESQDEIIEKINDLKANGGKNMAAGLKEGLKILNDRRLNHDRVGAIMLMSDGDQNVELGDCRKVDQVDQFPVYTFSVGTGFTPEVLQEIAKKSDGGTFSDVQNQNDLSIAFSQCLARLLTVVVKDLKLTIKQFNEESEIKNVFIGNYPQKKNVDGSITISFGNLYNKEVRKVLVNLLLPIVDPPIEKTSDVLEVTYTHSCANDEKGLFEAPPITATVKRMRTATDREISKVILEENRVKTVNSVREARVLADMKRLEDAKGKAVEAKNSLEGVDVDDPEQLIETLTSELQQVLDYMTTQEIYEEQGRPYFMSFESSHDRQRGATRGDLDMLPLPFLAPCKDAFFVQANGFEDGLHFMPLIGPPNSAQEYRFGDRIADRMGNPFYPPESPFIIRATKSIYDMLKSVIRRT